jgi:hypothetical protein
MRRDWWQLVVLIGILGGVGEALLAIGDPGVVVFAAIFFVGAALAYRRKLIGVIIVGLVSLLEAVFVPFYPHESTTDVIIQITFGALGVAGVVAAVGVFLERRRSSAAAAA